MHPLTAMLHRELKIRTTNAIYVFWDVFFPLGYLLVFGVGMNEALGGPPSSGPLRQGFGGQDPVSYNDFFLAGVLGMASLGVAANSSWGFFMDRDNGIFYEMLTYPMSRAQYLAGKVLFNVGLALLQAALTLALAIFWLGVDVSWSGMPLTLFAIAAGTAGWFAFYAIFSLRIRRNDAYNTVTSIFYFVFLFASSIFYPLEPLPTWFRVAAFANPITWQVDVLRYATIGVGNAQTIAVEGAAFAVFGMVSFWLAVTSLKQQE